MKNIEQKIAEYNPKMKLIWIFRNPIDRAYSNYKHDVFLGDEWRSFKSCLENEKNRGPYHRYIEKGYYYLQVEKYLKYFSMEQMHFIVFEDFIKNKKVELKKVFHFLGASPENYNYDEDIHAKSSPASRFHPLFLYFSRKYVPFKNRFSDYIWKIHFKHSKKVKMNANEREFLKNIYSTHNKQLADLIQKDLSVWNY
jgi:hypothetical protein